MIDEINEENFKVTTLSYYIFYDKSQKNKIYLFSCIRIFCFILLLLLFIREIRIILSKKYKLLIYEVFNYLFKSSKNNNNSLEDTNKYIQNISLSFDNLVLIILKLVYKFLIFLWKIHLYWLIFIFKALKIFFSNYLIVIVIRCIFFLYFILALSFYYHESCPVVNFISDNY